MRHHRFHPLTAVALAIVAAAAGPARSDIGTYQQGESFALVLGTVPGVAPGAPSVEDTIIRSPGALWMQLHVGDRRLGPDDAIIVTSLTDHATQRLDARSLAEWSDRTALFNGDAVLVELHTVGGDAAYAVIDGSTATFAAGDAGSGSAGTRTVAQPRSLCGADGRAASTDNRVGRISGCTAWRVTTGALLTAGHCCDFDPDEGDPLLPDGVLDLSGVVEFNVPASSANGIPVAAAPDDQYPIDTTNVRWHFDGEGQGLGKDYCVFTVNRNSNTGLLPHEAYGFPFRMTREAPSGAATIRVTGFGLDSTPTGSTGGRNAQNRTNQTGTGPFLRETTSGADILLEYQVDTEGANSGSPVIREADGLAVGIHTNAGCGTNAGNTGTSFEHDALEDAIHDTAGASIRFVDAGHPLRVTQDGSAFRPDATVAHAVTQATSGSVVSIVAGSYSADAGQTFGADGKAVLLVAPVGDVVLGN